MFKSSTIQITLKIAFLKRGDLFSQNNFSTLHKLMLHAKKIGLLCTKVIQSNKSKALQSVTKVEY